MFQIERLSSFLWGCSGAMPSNVAIFWVCEVLWQLTCCDLSMCRVKLRPILTTIEPSSAPSLQQSQHKSNSFTGARMGQHMWVDTDHVRPCEHWHQTTLYPTMGCQLGRNIFPIHDLNIFAAIARWVKYAQCKRTQLDVNTYSLTL